MTKTKELVKTETKKTSLISQEMPDFLKKLEVTDRGNENLTMEDMALPRLEIVQDMSPCRKKTDPSYITGAEEGMLYNNVTRKLYGEKVLICFSSFQVEYLVWKDRKTGGGFKGKYNTLQEAQKAVELDKDKDSLTIEKAHQHFGTIFDQETGHMESIVLSMSKSKEKISRRLNTIIRMQGGDRFSRVYEITTVQEQNAAGQPYYNYQFKNVGYPTEALYNEAEKIYNLTQEGRITASTEGLATEVETEQEEF